MSESVHRVGWSRCSPLQLAVAQGLLPCNVVGEVSGRRPVEGLTWRRDLGETGGGGADPHYLALA